jgi:hypothetical protein
VTRLRWQLEILALRHGLWALPGALALGAAVWLWASWLPAQQQALAAAHALPVPVPKAPEALALPVLPPAQQAPQAVQRLFALAAEHGVQVSLAEYRRNESATAGRWQVQLPARASYPQLRRFLRAAQAIPGLSIDEMQMRRDPASGVEARLLFSVWYAQEGRG